MASTTFRPVPFEEFAADIARRRRQFSTGDVPRNAGNRRTESKKALLAAIKEAGGDW
jgi:hypothetical protein